ncbi:hypothetical protein H2248_003078 [Termitomyces sp. 'cryptogamus']|nr:hypothetical protein H2248_003078 [Termitomyces sp. 'cryptogamus']
MAQVTPSGSSSSPDVDELPPLREHYGEFKAIGWDYDAEDIVKWAAEHGHHEDYVNALRAGGESP